MSICMVLRLDGHQCPSNVKLPYILIKFSVYIPKFSVLTNFDLLFYRVLTSGIQKRDKGLLSSLSNLSLSPSLFLNCSQFEPRSYKIVVIKRKGCIRDYTSKFKDSIT